MSYFKDKADEIASFLSELIRFDTTNPPGNELEAAKFVAEKLGEYGINCEILTSNSNRGNVIARIPGSSSGPRLLLLSHLDVVPAKPSDWRHHPFSGEIKDGYVWGRGAIDDKGHVAMEVFTLIALIENRVEFNGEIIFATTADEEMGGKYGAKWLVENHPEKVKADYVINEGGGFGLPAGDKVVFAIQTSEKGVYWFKLKVKGRPGHASMPLSGENAIVKISKAIKELEEHKMPITPNIHVKLFIETLASATGKGLLSKILLSRALGEHALKRIYRSDKSLAALLDAMLRNTITPTVIKGGYKENIIPDEVECIFDCRLLPGFNEKHVLNHLKEVLKELEYEVEFLHKDPSTQSPINTQLFNIIDKVLRKNVPNAIVTPYMSTGGTDSRFFRRKFNSIAYGFEPIVIEGPLKEFMSMIHGINERISIKNLVFGTKVTFETIVELMKAR